MTSDGLSARRLVIGSGGCGRTHQLRVWLQAAGLDSDDGAAVIWLSGHPLRPPDEDAVQRAVAAGPTVIVVDDLQWFGEAALEQLMTVTADTTPATPAVWASRRPWPSNQTLQIFNDLLTETAGASRVGLLDEEEFGSVVAAMRGSATSSEVLERLFSATGGSPGFAADAVATGWDGNLDSVPEELVDAVTGRIKRCGDDASALIRLLAVAPDLDMATAVEALDESVNRNEAQRGTRAGGVLDQEGGLIPLARAAVIADLTESERATLHDRFAIALTPTQPDVAIEHVIAGSGTVPGATDALVEAAERLQLIDPARALELTDQAELVGLQAGVLALVRARSAFELGSGQSLAYLDDVPPDLPGAAVVGFGIDVRDLRWQSATERNIDGPLREPLHALIGALIGEPQHVSTTDELGPQGSLINMLAGSVEDLAAGRTADALSGFASASDDYDRIRPDTPLGVTPHALGALASLAVGDLSAGEGLLNQAIDRRAGGDGEHNSHRLLRAYLTLVDGDFRFALELVREGENNDWPQRDRLLLATLDAALARRSGDTTRLRDAWRRADPILVRQSMSWFLVDPFIELLAAGARVGDTRRVEPIAAALREQLASLPTSGPGPVAGGWLDLQLALARDDDAGLERATADLADAHPVDPRSEARVAAAAVWDAINRKQADEATATAVAEQLKSVGDGWEASRLLGQAALDQSDAKTARRLLEAARTYAVEPAEEGGGGLLALGLSDREAEVAVLVAEGRTHKEVGAQLYISPKTVEHHVARIRQKLGAGSRAELLAIIREATAAPGV